MFIGADSMVSRDIEAGSLAAGNPVNIRGTSSDYNERRKELMAESPCFGDKYILRANVSDTMKAEMNAKMASGTDFTSSTCVPIHRPYPRKAARGGLLQDDSLHILIW